MAKYQIRAYEEVFYCAEVEAKNEDDAMDKFAEELGDYHPWQTNHSFETLEIKRLKGSKNA